MSVSDWFRDRVDIGLLGREELADAAAAEAVGSGSSKSPFGLTFAKQPGGAPRLAAQHKARFDGFVASAPAGETLIFFAHVETITRKVPRQGEADAQARAATAKAAAARAKAQAQAAAEAAAKAAEKKEGGEEGKAEGEATSPPDVGADEAALAATASGGGAVAAPADGTPAAPADAAAGPLAPGSPAAAAPGTADFLSFQQEDEDPLYEIVEEERLLYRCVLASTIEEKLIRAAKAQATLRAAGINADEAKKSADAVDAITDGAGDDEGEDAASVLSAMQAGVVYFSRKESGAGQDLSSSCIKSAKQLGMPSDTDPTVLRDVSLANAVEWGCLRGLSTQNLSHLSTSMRSIFLPFLDSMMAEANNNSGSKMSEDKDKEGKKKKSKKKNTADSSASTSASASGSFWGHASEFRSQMSKFVAQLGTAIQQTHGRVSLPMRPEVELDPNRADLAAADFETFRTLEEMVQEWTEVVKDVVAIQQRAEPSGRGPMAEIEFWRNQHGKLSTLFEQLSSPRAALVVKVLRIAGSTLLDDFMVNQVELSRLHVEAADNVKFLATLERHFKTLEAGIPPGSSLFQKPMPGGDGGEARSTVAVASAPSGGTASATGLRSIEETLDSMMNGLRMIWIISRHYNTDERMVNLMERVADAVAEVVEGRLDVSTIFRDTGAKGAANRDLIAQAARVLDKWQSSYFETRKQIEDATPHHRWEFHTEKKTLFERTNYMSTVCKDLIHVVDVVTQFKLFLGPDLREVTGKGDEIDAVLREVERAIVPLETTAFSVFNYTCHTSWRQLMASFDEHVVSLDRMCHKFLDTAFNTLRSAEGAFEVLQRFQHMETRGTIQKQLMQKFDAVLVRYGQEVQLCTQLFAQHKRNPTALSGKNQPPVAGAIAYASALYRRAKKPIMSFIRSDTLKKSPHWDVERERYLALARDIDQFCSSLYEKWVRSSTATAARELSEFILGPAPSEVRDPNDGRRIVVLPDWFADANYYAREDVAESNPDKWHVNFSNDLSEVIREARYLDRLGYTVPDAVLNVALQGDIYTANIAQLQQMLLRYEEEMGALSPVERNLFANPIADLHREIEPGFNVLNWSSLNIPLFIKKANSATETFRNVLRRVRKSADVISAYVKEIAGTNLINVEADFPASEDSVRLEATDFYFKLDKRRQLVLEELIQKSETLRPMFISIERLVAGTDNGRSPALFSYYAYCERQIYNAICEMIVRSIATLQNLLNIGDVTDNKILRPALIHMRASINRGSGDVQVSPVMGEVIKYVDRSLNCLVDSARKFKRFEHGSCHPCRDVLMQTQSSATSKGKNKASAAAAQMTVSDAGAEPYSYTMFDDVKSNPAVIAMMLRTSEAIHHTHEKAKRYLGNWKRAGKGLWDTSRMKTVQKTDYSSHSTVFFDSHLAGYEELSRGIQKRQMKIDIDFMHLDCFPCGVTVRAQAQKWKFMYGKAIHDVARKRLMALTEQFDALRSDLGVVPEDLAAFKFLLGKIREVEEMGMEMELEMGGVHEIYEMLLRYDIIRRIDDDAEEPPVGDGTVGNEKTADELKADHNELVASEGIHQAWKDLVCLAKTLEMRQVQLKDDFCEMTKKDVLDFGVQVQAAWKIMRETGAGSAMAADNLDKGLELLEDAQQKIAKMEKRRMELVSAERLFDLPNTEYPDMNTMKSELAILETIYGLYAELKEFSDSQSSTLWTQLNIASLIAGAEALDKKSNKMRKKIQPTRSVLESVVAAVTGFKDSLPLIEQLKSPAMKPRHWQELMKVTGTKFTMDPKTFKLRNIFAMDLSRFSDDVNKIAYKAGQELKIESSIATLRKHWKTCEFTIQKYRKDGKDRGWLLASAEDIKMDLDDQLLNLTSIGGSRFVGPFLQECQNWTRALNNVLDCIDEWFKVQQKWQYLESIFVGSEDIRMQLPEAAKNFDRIDKGFKDLMKGAAADHNVLSQCEKANRLEELTGMTERLDRCQKSLSDYLETKRNIFPRFYFISDDELLSILGSSDPLSVQVHMSKMFANCRQLFFMGGGKKVIGMQSAKKEQYDMVTPVSTDGVVEDWLGDVEAEMQASLKSITKEGVFRYAATMPGGAKYTTGTGVPESPRPGDEDNEQTATVGTGIERVDWIDQQLGMVGIMGSQVWWTWEVEDAFRKVQQAGEKYAVKVLLDRLSSMVNDLINKTRDMTMSKNMRRKLGSLIILDVHGRDIVDAFVRDSILDEREFAWESQLRFYWEKEDNDVAIKQCTGKFTYGYEYQGMNGRLVITPLTDRIVMTLTQALTFHLGGAPAGPAGTGKTETVKDLAKTMGLPCFVTNCGEGLDYRAVGAIFSGLAASGAWGCFDEFNRINVEVLSVVSAQLKSIQTALHLGQEKRDIGMGREIRIRVTCGFFITMNPGYAGRTELPDNLKALFRPIAVIVPDMGAIAEIMLMSEGFNEARVLGKKMTVLYKLASEQLSKQYHYGFGLREMKTVLVMAGSLKRSEPDLTEDVVLMRALRDMNMPKFVFDDVPLFLALIQDLFPGLTAPRVGYKILVDAIVQDLEAQGLRHSDEEVFMRQVDKIVQLYETMIVRHTSQVVGPPGGGKTVVIETLKRAIPIAFGIAIKTQVLNPKAIELYELYGEMDAVTRDWTDGILSNIFREMNEPLPAHKEGKERHWLLFDGDVDAEWVENMNSVMDDNRLLTLPNGERIQLKDYSKLIIETYDLQFASPATISRCGMVWVDPKFLGYRPFWERWCTQQLKSVTAETIPGQSKKGKDGGDAEGGDAGDDDIMGDEDEDEGEDEGNSQEDKFAQLKDMFDKYVPKCLDLVLEGVKDGEMLSDEERLRQVIPISDLSIVKQLCVLLETIVVHPELQLAEEEGGGGDGGDSNDAKGDDTEDPFGEPDQLEGMFVFCLMWAAGGALDGDSRTKLNDLITSVYVEGSGKELFEHVYNPIERRWEKWEERVPAYKQPVPFKFYQVVVPTADSVMYTYLLDRTVAGSKPCLLVGEPGTAKTTVVQNYLYGQDPNCVKRLEINLSSRTSGRDVQTNIEANTEKRSGKIYGAPAGKKLAVFIDDMNMPKVDHYGTQQPVALLLFLVGRGLMYRLGKDVELLQYRDMRYIGAMGPPGGGRNKTDPRFVSRFNMFNLTPPSEEILQNIFESIIVNYYDQPGFKPAVKEVCPKLVVAMLNLYHHVQERLPPTPSKFHYIFTIRDLGRIIEGCCLATPDVFGQTPASVVRLWRNECTRLFCDRLTTAEDGNTVAAKVEEQIVEHFGNFRDEVMKDPLIFGDFTNAVQRLQAEEGEFEDLQLYADQGDFSSVRAIFDGALEEHNMTQKPMSLVLFQSALEHLTRVYRIMRLDRGNAMLVGFGGSGKQSMTHLAAFTAGYKVFEITLSRGYGLTEFREDIKELYKLLVQAPTVMLFTDAHVVDESFMEVINNMLTTGMVRWIYFFVFFPFIMFAVVVCLTKYPPPPPPPTHTHIPLDIRFLHCSR